MNRLTQGLALLAVSTSLWSQLRPTESTANQDHLTVQSLTARALTIVDAQGQPRYRLRIDSTGNTLIQESLDAAGVAQATTRVRANGGMNVSYGSLGPGSFMPKPAIEFRVDKDSKKNVSTSMMLGSSKSEYSTYFTSNPEIGAMGVLGALDQRATILGVGTANNGITIRDKGVTRIEATHNGPVAGIAVADKRGALTFGSAVEDRKGKFLHYARKSPGEQLWTLINEGMALKSMLDHLSK